MEQTHELQAAGEVVAEVQELNRNLQLEVHGLQHKSDMLAMDKQFLSKEVR